MINNGLRRGLDAKRWEQMTPCPVATTAGGFTMTDPSGEDRFILYIAGNTSVWRYDHLQDAWQQLPNPGMAGSIVDGACGTYHPYGPNGTALTGSTTTQLRTNLTISRGLKGFKIRFTGGPNAGLEREIKSNTYGSNCILDFTEALPTAITTATTYQFLTGRFWVFSAGTTPGLAYYDRALNTWTQRVTTGIPAWGTDGQLVATHKQDGTGFASGKATGGTTTTMVNSAKNWTAGEWVNYQVRFTAGANAGAVRLITESTANAITFAALPVACDATSEYTLEGNEDALYLYGNNSAATYRYSISGNAWVTGPNLPAAAGAGVTADWVFDCTDPVWMEEPNVLNGRYIYIFRGAAVTTLYRYDIATGLFAGLGYAVASTSFSTGSSSDYDSDYIFISESSTGRIYIFNIPQNRLGPFAYYPILHSTARNGDKLWMWCFVDSGGDKIKFLYQLRHNAQELFRVMLIE